MQKKVFISFSSRDRKMAESICNALELRGHGCWMSSRDVEPGENYQGAIVRAICEAGAMVLVFSANANNSDEIKKELSLASQQKLVVIPVRAEDVLPSADYRYELATRQWIDLFNDWEQALDRLARQIDHVIPREATLPIEKAAEPAPVREAPEAKTAPLSPVPPAPNAAGGRTFRIAAAAVLALLAVAVVAYLVTGGPGPGLKPAKKPESPVQLAVAAAQGIEKRARVLAAQASKVPEDQTAPGAEGHPVGNTFYIGGDRYDGEIDPPRKGWPDDFPSGKGEEGAVGDRRWNGIGVYTASSGRNYRERVGEFVGGVLEGYGKEYRRDGTVWVGMFRNNQFDGFGAKYDAQGKLVEQGIFKAGKLDVPMGASGH